MFNIRHIIAGLMALCLISAPLASKADPAPATVTTITSSVVTATTTLVLTGGSNQRLYVYFLGGLASGTQSASTVVWEYGTGAACGTGTTVIPGSVAQTQGASAGIWTAFYGGSLATTGISPAPVPIIIPVGNNVCAVTAGTTISTYLAAVSVLQ